VVENFGNADNGEVFGVDNGIATSDTHAFSANAEEVELDPKYQAQAGNPVGVTPLGEIFLTVAAADRAGEQQRLDKEIARIETEARAVEEKLKNKSFVDRAPAAVVEEHRRRLKDFSAQLAKLKQARESLN